MQVTSIRFERELIDRLKDLAGDKGYQALVREVLWDYVKQEDPEMIERSQIRSLVSAIAYRDEICSLTGETIEEGEDMALGLLRDSRWVPICWEAIENPTVSL